MNDTGGQCAHKTQRIADGDDQFPYTQLIRIAQRRRRQIRRRNPQDREITPGVLRSDRGRKRSAVPQSDRGAAEIN